MNRRSNKCNGWVNFPVKSKEYRNTKEGGMFVFLVIVDAAATATERDDDTRPWPVCCANDVIVVMSEGVVGDDRIPSPKSPTAEEYGHTEEQFRAAEQSYWDAHPESFHYPDVMKKVSKKRDHIPQESDFFSIPYLAAILLGTTGWSGWSDEKNDSWKCTFDDLSEEGKQLYKSLEALYGKSAELHLVTYIDT